jgi:hypothetical protein
LSCNGRSKKDETSHEGKARFHRSLLICLELSHRLENSTTVASR